MKKLLVVLFLFWRKNKGIFINKDGKIESYSYFLGFKRAWVLAEIKTNPKFIMSRGETKYI
jgi:hypothetical protein